ncbi:MAG: cyclopropane fatty acyl phospholipid synthase [Parvularculaceae bacterium]
MANPSLPNAAVPGRMSAPRSAERKVQELLSRAGLTVNGPNPYDPQILDERLYARVLGGGALAMGESYMDRWWDCERLDELAFRATSARLNKKFGVDLETALYVAGSRLLNLQTRARARQVAERHYDLDNDLYMSFLDPYNQYTCGYFKDTDDLNVAQERKLDLICRKIGVSPGDRILDIGCGWGGFAKFAAERYGAHVTGVSISDEQIAYAREFTKGLPVAIEKMDYRSLSGSFDKVVVVGMIEHVGYKNYRTLMETVHRVLKDGGLFILHTIGSNTSTTRTDPWTHKYIFPNGMAPSARQLASAGDGLFDMEDWHNFGAYYDKTLLAWMKNFDAAWPRLKEKYDARFYRMWKYYLLASAGAFRARKNQLWQIVLSKGGVPGGYRSIR